MGHDSAQLKFFDLSCQFVEQNAPHHHSETEELQHQQTVEEMPGNGPEYATQEELEPEKVVT